MTEILATFIIGIVCGIGIMILYLAYKFKAILNQIDEHIDRATETMFLGINVEKHGEFYRFYQAKDNQFVFQTTTLDNIREAFSNQFPDKTCYIEGGDDDAVNELKQALKK